MAKFLKAHYKWYENGQWHSKPTALFFFFGEQKIYFLSANKLRKDSMTEK